MTSAPQLTRVEALAVADELDRMAGWLRLLLRETPGDEYERGMRDTHARIAKALIDRAANIRAPFAATTEIH